MPEAIPYNSVRRKLLPKNPYFSHDLIECRRQLGIPSLGFTKAVESLCNRVPTNPSSILPPKIEMDELIILCGELELPLNELIDWRREEYSHGGLDFDQLLEKNFLCVLHIFRTDTWTNWWIEREYSEARVNSPTEIINTIQKLLPTMPSTLITALVNSAKPLLDPRLPSVDVANTLISRYSLGEDYLIEVHSLLLGHSPGGGQADQIIWERVDGTGFSILIPDVS